MEAVSITILCNKNEHGEITSKTNFAGGTLGGISNGQTIYFSVASNQFNNHEKQQTVTTEKNKQKLEASGRHDPCVLPNVPVPIVDAYGSIVTLWIHYLRHKAQNA